MCVPSRPFPQHKHRTRPAGPSQIKSYPVFPWQADVYWCLQLSDKFTVFGWTINNASWPTALALPAPSSRCRKRVCQAAVCILVAAARDLQIRESIQFLLWNDSHVQSLLPRSLAKSLWGGAGRRFTRRVSCVLLPGATRRAPFTLHFTRRLSISFPKPSPAEIPVRSAPNSFAFKKKCATVSLSKGCKCDGGFAVGMHSPVTRTEVSCCCGMTDCKRTFVTHDLGMLELRNYENEHKNEERVMFHLIPPTTTTPLIRLWEEWECCCILKWGLSGDWFL